MLNYNEKLNENEASVMLRDLHTIKGSARSVGLKFLAKKVHVIEDTLEPIRISLTNKEKISFDINNKELINLNILYKEYRENYKNLFEKNNSFNPSKVAIDIIDSLLVQKNNSVDDILSWISQFKSDSFFSLKNLFMSFKDTLNELSLNLNKKISLEIPNWDIYMDSKISISLSEAFTHSLRNALDHGIETREERKQKGKNEEGLLYIKYEELSDLYLLQIFDDGRGVNLKKVFDIAFEKKLITNSFDSYKEEDIIDLLFAPGFSTKEEISELSGRGIGLDAVRNSCKKFEINCKIISKKEEGSTFQLFIPKKYIKFIINVNNTLKVI